MVFGSSHISAEADRRGSASSHRPSRKLTYVRVSVKGNIVNTNVYTISDFPMRATGGPSWRSSWWLFVEYSR
jgi:hypothetical protein